MWYTLGPGCTVDVCLCGKKQAVAAGELDAGRCLAHAVASAARQQQRQWQPGQLALLSPPSGGNKSRVGVLQRHLATVFPPTMPFTVGGVQRPLLSCPTAASADAVVSLLREFISVPSVNPDQVLKSGVDPLADPNCGEAAFATRLGEKFQELPGVEVILEDCSASWMYADDVGAGFAPRLNLYAVIETSSAPDAKWLAIDTHLDTVMVNGMEPFGAFDATLTPDGKIHGRGACDTKATFALVLAILQERHAAGKPLLPPGTNLVVCGTCGEETGRLGANYFREFLLGRGIFIDEMLVAEPSESLLSVFFCSFSHAALILLQRYARR